ncbi:hypothetical protein M2408_003030 [Sphingobacterium sp. BIGb0165]|nr:hypothetical protein [Sphingobacterium sp. BIGb0165]
MNHKAYTYYFIFAIITLTVYSSFVFVGFCSADDGWMLLENSLVQQREYSFTFFKSVLSQINDIQYSPLNTIYYILLNKIDGFNPSIYHIASITIHIFNTIFVYRLINYFVQNYEKSFILALIWCVHPLNVESVIWISASKILLSSFFSLSAILIVLKHNQRNIRSQMTIACLVILSCLCKEQSVILPVIFFLLDIFYHKNDSLKKINFFEYATYFTIVVIFSLLTLQINAESMELVRYNFSERVILLFYSLFWYLFNCFFPFNLHYNYGYPFQPGESIPIVFYFFVIFWVLLFFLCIKKKWYAKPYFYLILISLCLLLPCLHIVPVYRPSFFADRYMYLPLIFILLLFYNFLTPKLYQYRKWIVLIYVGYFIVYSHFLVFNWFYLNIE